MPQASKCSRYEPKSWPTAAIGIGSPPSIFRLYAMLPAQPPNSRRIRGTRKATFRICTLSGRMWFLNWSWNTMMVSNASEPQIRADIVIPRRNGQGAHGGERGAAWQVVRAESWVGLQPDAFGKCRETASG